MKPTNNLRFVERDVIDVIATGDNYEIAKTVKRRVLQQWWACDPDSLLDWNLRVNGEWRDVPLEIEGE